MHILSFFQIVFVHLLYINNKTHPDISRLIIIYCISPLFFSIFMLTFHTRQLIIKVRRLNSHFALSQKKTFP